MPVVKTLRTGVCGYLGNDTTTFSLTETDDTEEPLGEALEA